MSDHEPFREWVGSYLLGALEPRERADFESHLAECPICQAETVALAPLPGLLRDRGEPPVPASMNPDVGDQAIRVIQQDRRRLERRTQTWRAGTLTVGVLLLFVAGMTLWPNSANEQDEPDGVFSIEGRAVGNVQLTAKGWGVAVNADLAQLPDQPVYELWIITSDGKRELAASWGPTAQHRARLSGSSSLKYDTVTAVEIWSGTSDMLIGVADIGT